ncbi:MAG: hypothetical protein WD013_02170 [Gemmatimonadota bacterium]
MPRVRLCGRCGYLGQGIPYFRRTGHATLLVVSALLTYGIGGLIYWVVKREDQICPGCGTAWRRSVPVGGTCAHPVGSSEDRGSGYPGNGRGGRNLAVDPRIRTKRVRDLPSNGRARRLSGFILALGGSFLLGLGVLQGGAEVSATGFVLLVLGAAVFTGGLQAGRRRRRRVFEVLQTEVLDAAVERRGRLTATDIARELELTLPRAEKLLFTMDDGVHVRSEVTSEGLLVFDFPEVRMSNVLQDARQIAEA